MKQNSKLLLAASLLLLAVIAVYSNHFNNPFQFDDGHTIVRNIYIRDVSNIPRFFKDATTFSSLPANQSYRPVVTTTLALDYAISDKVDKSLADDRKGVAAKAEKDQTIYDKWATMGGLNPFFFHLSDFCWFLLQGLLMYFLFLKIMDYSFKHAWNQWFAFFTVALYMLHTVNAETINYIISRSDLLSTLAIVAALYIYAVDGWGRKYFLYLIPLGLGILAKPTSIMFIGILFVYILYFETEILEKGIDFKNTFNKFLHLGITLVFCLAGYKFMDHMTPPTWTGGGLDLKKYVITQPYVILHYFKMFFLPTELSADTDWETLESIADYRFFAGMAFLIAMATVALLTMRSKRLRPISFGIAWFFLALVPTSFIPLAEVMNDHRMFFPFVGLVLSVGWAISLLLISMQKALTESSTTRVAVIAVVCLILASYGYGVHERNDVWSTDIKLWGDVAQKSPKNGRGLMNYGLALAAQGKYTEALKVYNDAMKLVPYYSYLHINMAITLDRLGDKVGAEQHYQQALKLTPANQAQESTYFYGIWLAGQGRLTEAKYFLKKTIEISPAHPDARYQLMDVLYRNNETKELKDVADETLKIIPNDARTMQYLSLIGTAEERIKLQETAALQKPTAESLLNLSLLYYNKGEYQKAIETCNKVLELQPQSSAAYNNICSSYNQLKKWDDAIRACEKAVAIDANFQLAKNNLAWARSQRK